MRTHKLSFLIMILNILLILIIIAGCQSTQSSSTFTASPSSEQDIKEQQSKMTATDIPVEAYRSFLPSGENGNIDRMALITDTGATLYYELTYWSDGLRVTGLIGFPKGEGLFPAIIINRGGNQDYGVLCGWELIPFVESGYVAVGSQYRGNAGGEGQEEFGGADVNDVLNLIPLLKSLPFTDPDRIGMAGLSRGGMQTAIALKQDMVDGRQDIQAAAIVSGVADLFMWAEERPDLLADVLIPLIGASPEEQPELYEARSATYWSDQINAPLLIQHGENDERVSVEQAKKLAQALEDAGKTVALIIYPGEDHALSQHNKGFPEMLAWFQKYFELPGEDLSLASHAEAIQEVSAWFRENHPPP